MLEIFEYDFIKDAFIVGLCLAIILPCMGLTIVLKRLSMIGDTLSHASLTGLTIGLVFGFSPILSAIIACMIAGLSVEVISNRLKKYQEISTVIILAASIGLAGVFSSFSNKGASSINAYLFGSIVTISKQEFYLVLVLTVLIIGVYRYLYLKLYLSMFDYKAAELLGINMKFLNFMITILSAVVISVAAKTIGSLIVSSLLVIPVICAMQYSKTYKNTLILAIGFSIIFVYGGLLISYYYNLRPGSIIVLLAVIMLLIALITKRK